MKFYIANNFIKEAEQEHNFVTDKHFIILFWQ